MPGKLQKYLRKLKRDFPLRRPVKVRTYESIVGADGGILYGVIQDKGEYFEIWIRRCPDEAIMVDTLFHEWCHAMLWPKCSRKHTDLFFKTYGQVYRHYLD